MIELQLRRLDFRCTTCGYGVVRQQPPERCPMCTGTRWRQQPQRHADDLPLRPRYAAHRRSGAMRGSAD